MSYRRKPRGDDQCDVNGAEEKNIWKVSFGISGQPGLQQSYPLLDEYKTLGQILGQNSGIIADTADGLIFKVKGSVIGNYFTDFTGTANVDYIIKQYKDPRPTRNQSGHLVISLENVAAAVRNDRQIQNQLTDIPNVITAIYWGRLFCVMKDGGISLYTLAATNKNGGRVNEEKMINTVYIIYVRVLTILGEMHSRGVYHGDIHMGNILTQQTKSGLEVNLIDFTRSSNRQFQGRDLTDDVYLRKKVNPFIKDLERVGVEMLRFLWFRYLTPEHQKILFPSLTNQTHMVNPYACIVVAWVLMDIMVQNARACKWNVSPTYEKMFAFLYVGARAASRLTECSSTIVTMAMDDIATLYGLGSNQVSSRDWDPMVSELGRNIHRNPHLKKYLNEVNAEKRNVVQKDILHKIFPTCI